MTSGDPMSKMKIVFSLLKQFQWEWKDYAFPF